MEFLLSSLIRISNLKSHSLSMPNTYRVGLQLYRNAKGNKKFRRQKQDRNCQKDHMRTVTMFILFRLPLCQIYRTCRFKDRSNDEHHHNNVDWSRPTCKYTAFRTFIVLEQAVKLLQQYLSTTKDKIQLKQASQINLMV